MKKEEMIQASVEKLLNGVEGSVVMNELRAHYKSLYSLDTVSSHVRQAIINGGHRAVEYDDSELRLYEHEAAVKAFLGASLKDQVAIQRSHKWRQPQFSDAASDALARLQILPGALNSFGMTAAEIVELKRRKEQSLLAKNETLIVVPDASKLLKTATAWLEAATPRCSDAKLVLPLLLVSGRREAEICNGKSIFSPSPLGSTYALFQGQLKTKSEAPAAYTIPLLCDYAVFKTGLEAWRAKHSEVLTNVESKRKYESSLRRDLSKVLSLSAKTHALRSIYIQYVWCCYSAIPYTFARLCMACLGHSSMAESHSYSNVRLENTASVAFGTLLL